MKKYLILNTQIDGGVLHLTLVPSQRESGLEFQPGQYATIGFRGANGRMSPMRCFSITSPKGANYLEFASRLGGDFTHALSELTPGDEVFVQGPFGEFTMSKKFDSQVVMIAGGIGVTPFMSMIRSATEAADATKITLLYSYRLAERVPFLDELRQLEQRNPQLQIVLFATDQTGQSSLPRMVHGRMSEQHIKHVAEASYAGSTYFVCGPKGFTENAETLLKAHGVSEDRIVTESFTQASKVTLGSFNLRKLTYGFAGATLIAGVFSIAFLDLSRYVPSHTVSATSSQTTTTPTTITTNNTAQTNNNTTPTTTTTATPTSNTSSSSQQQTNTYQQPVTQQS